MVQSVEAEERGGGERGSEWTWGGVDGLGDNLHISDSSFLKIKKMLVLEDSSGGWGGGVMKVLG